MARTGSPVAGNAGGRSKRAAWLLPQREREAAIDMHRLFQRDLCKMRLTGETSIACLA